MTIRKSLALFVTLAALEDQIYELRRRVERCEGGNNGGGYNPRPSSSVCITQDTIRGDIFIGKGRIQLEAEQAACESCVRNSSAIYCKSQARCSDSRDARLTDSIHGDNFKGEGESAIEAEYNVRRSCASPSAATYCMQKVTCQSY